MLVWDFCYPHAFLFFSFLSLYLKNWWSHLHSLAWTDGVIRNKILNSILKRIISAPIPCKQLSSRQQGKASKTPHPLRGLSKVESITWALGVGTCTGQGWETPAEKRASSRICSGIFSWDCCWVQFSPGAGDAQGTAVGGDQGSPNCCKALRANEGSCAVSYPNRNVGALWWAI